MLETKIVWLEIITIRKKASTLYQDVRKNALRASQEFTRFQLS
jgi:hypothetical protein